MHIYETSYKRLLDAQPADLDNLAKHIRIDRLSCLDMQLHMPDEAIKDRNTTWFYALSVILNQIYLAAHPEICELPCFVELAKTQLLQYTKREISDDETLKELRHYILNRKTLINHLTGGLHGRAQQSE